MRLSTFLALLCGFLWSAGLSHAVAPALDFELQDQYGNLHRVAFPNERISVLVLADRTGAKQLDSWVRPLHARYGKAIDILGVARLAGVPTGLKPLFRALFRKTLKYPVMLDWSGAISTRYQYEANLANLLVLDSAGRIEYRFNGAATPDVLKTCFRRIVGLLGTSAPREE